MLRLIKSLLVLFIGLHALFYALQNFANLAAAHGAMVYVMSGADHEVYPATMFFKVADSTFAWIALTLVLAGELGVAFFGLKGGWDLFQSRNASAEDFHTAKRAGVIAAGLALVVWFGLFMTVGAAFFQMWQTQAGTASMEGAFMYAMASAVTMIFVSLTDD
jgi:predicted small integral membrane protein